MSILGSIHCEAKDPLRPTALPLLWKAPCERQFSVHYAPKFCNPPWCIRGGIFAVPAANLPGCHQRQPLHHAKKTKHGKVRNHLCPVDSTASRCNDQRNPKGPHRVELRTTGIAEPTLLVEHRSAVTTNRTPARRIQRCHTATHAGSYSPCAPRSLSSKT